MIADRDERALAVIEIDRAGSVRQDRGADAEASEHAHRKHNFLRGITFVEVHAPLHGDERHAGRFSDHELSAVARDGRAREARNFVVRDSRRGRELVGERAETGAEHERDARAQLRLRSSAEERFLDRSPRLD